MTIFVSNGMCTACGATVSGFKYGGINQQEAERMHNAFHDNMISRDEAKAMSAVKWCDPGDHAVKANTAGSQSFNGIEYDENGNGKSVEQYACPDHAYNKSARPTKALTADAALTIDEPQD